MMFLVVQIIMVLMPALWLSIGFYDNIRHRDVNGAIVNDVLSMRVLQDEYPDIYAVHQHRAIGSPRLRNALFALIVLAEGVVVLALWFSLCVLSAAMLGLMEPTAARSLAMLGPLGFATLWSSFLVAGNYWCYWMCHEGAQNTHFQMTLWGIGVLILLAL